MLHKNLDRLRVLKANIHKCLKFHLKILKGFSMMLVIHRINDNKL